MTQPRPGSRKGFIWLTLPWWILLEEEKEWIRRMYLCVIDPNGALINPEDGEDIGFDASPAELSIADSYPGKSEEAEGFDDQDDLPF
jgi:hypothetical protein